MVELVCPKCDKISCFKLKQEDFVSKNKIKEAIDNLSISPEFIITLEELKTELLGDD